MAAALDDGIVEPNTTFVDTGVVEVGGVYIRNWTNAAHGPVTMTECMQLSLNVCLANLGLELGPPTFYSYLDAFGVGKGTGVDLAGEVTGIYRNTSHPDWYWADLGTNTFGQGVSSTVVQMLKAVSAVANDGEMVQPHIVKAMVTDGKQHPITVLPAGSPISADTAHTLTDMLAVSLEKESSDALVSGYQVAGKTGTGEIATENGYTLEITNASFVGWGPTDDPKFLVYVWLEKPSTSIWGSQTAAPVFARVVERLVVLMNIPPDDQRMALEGIKPEEVQE
jgi:cell division protein FtsI/penicillin-binding protein 2